MTKPRKCRACRAPFTPIRDLQLACGLDCAIALAERAKAKAAKAFAAMERKEIRARRDRIKTLAQLAKEAEREVNRYVRARDYFAGCISCDRNATWRGQWHASHFRSVGAASNLRFNLWNIHKACSVCNNWLSGNISGYEPRLRNKIGNDRVEFLLSSNNAIKYNRDYLIRLKKIFSRKARRQEIMNETRSR